MQKRSIRMPTIRLQAVPNISAGDGVNSEFLSSDPSVPVFLPLPPKESVDTPPPSRDRSFSLPNSSRQNSVDLLEGESENEAAKFACKHLSQMEISGCVKEDPPSIRHQLTSEFQTPFEHRQEDKNGSETTNNCDSKNT